MNACVLVEPETKYKGAWRKVHNHDIVESLEYLNYMPLKIARMMVHAECALCKDF